MADPNPYSSSLTTESTNEIDPEILRRTALALAAAREQPPTLLGTLLKWPGTPLLVLMGILGSGTLLFLVVEESLSLSLPIGFAAFVAGAVLRDFGIARRIAKGWSAQSHFIDWRKVEAFQKPF